MIILTGVAGFVGTSLSEELAKRGYLVLGVDVAPPKERFTDLAVVDLTDREAVMKLRRFQPTTILHFAAQSRVYPSIKDPIQTYRANVQATVNVLELAVVTRARMVYASSEVVYGEADRYPAKESYNFRPSSPYAASKAAGDLMVSQVNGRGTKTVVLRSGMGFGPRSPPSQVVTKFMLNCMDGKPLVFPHGPVHHPTRDVNYIGNFVRGVMQVLEHEDVTGVFNLGSGRETSLLTLAERVLFTVGRGWIEYQEDYSYRENEEGMRTWLDITKAREAFGYDPKITLDEGLVKTYHWLADGGRAKYRW